MRDLARLARLDVALNFLYLGTCWALILLSVWLFAVERSGLTFVVAFGVVSSRHQALLNIEHDCIHNHFAYRFAAADSYAEAMAIEKAIKFGALGRLPRLNPTRPR